MTHECLESGILLYTLNFATARPIAFTSLHRHVHTIPLSVSYYCYHLVAARAERVKFIFHYSTRCRGQPVRIPASFWRYSET